MMEMFNTIKQLGGVALFIMLRGGLNAVRDLHHDKIDVGEAGTDGSAVSETQTGLQAVVTASEQSVTIVKENKANVVEYTLPSTVGTATTYREFSYKNIDGTNNNRVVFTGLEHNENDDIVIRQATRYRNPST